MFENDWAGALPKLAKGSDSQWKNAAEAELQVSRIPDDQANMAGLWWGIANRISEDSSTKRALQRYALDWYSRVVKSISAPLLKTVVELRIKELTPTREAIAAKPQPMPNNPPPKIPVQNKIGADRQLPIGQAINLLNLITLPENAIEGNWRTIAGALVCSPSRDARVMAPVVVSGNYEVYLEFTRNNGTEAISLLCPVGDATCEIILSGWNGSVAGLQMIDGKYYLISPTPMTHSEAQRLAAMRQGRLLTISSEAENQFVFEQAKGRALWMAGWRPTSSNVWRDERNRPLKMLKWDAREPNNHRGNQFRLMTAGVNPNWWDKAGGEKAYARIEWGEEYP